jgi:hypothetical protein
MGTSKKDKQTGQKSSSEVHPRHKEAMNLTKELIEKLLSSSDTSDSPGRAG